MQKEKKMKRKHSGHKNSYMDNLSDKQQLKQVNIGGDGQKKGCCERTTEALIMAAQEPAIRTNSIKAKIDKTQENSTYGIFGKAEKRVNHMLNKCRKLVQKE